MSNTIKNIFKSINNKIEERKEFRRIEEEKEMEEFEKWNCEYRMG